MTKVRRNKYSIIIPTFNRADILSRAIDSVLKQNYRNWELIIVDDGSTDNTEMMIRKNFFEKRLRYFKKENGGVGSARNMGLMYAKGEFIIFLDSDDELVEAGLSAINYYVEKFATVKSFIFNTIYGFKTGFSFEQEVIEYTYEDLLSYRFLGGDGFSIYHQSLFDNPARRFPEGINGGESLLHLELVRENKTIMIDKIVARINFDAENSLLRSEINTQKLENTVKINQLFLNRYFEDLRRYARGRLAGLYYANAKADFLLGRFRLGFENLLRALRYDPFNPRSLVLCIISMADRKFIINNYLIKRRNLKLSKLNNDQIKICIFNVNIYSLIDFSKAKSIGGSEVKLLILAKKLAEQNNYLITIITADWAQKAIERHFGINFLKSYKLGGSFIYQIYAIFVLWRRLKSADAKIYLCSGAGPEVGLIALFCKVYRRKFVFYTSSSVDCTLEKIKKLGTIRGWLYKVGISLAEAIVTQNEEDKDNLQKFHRKESVVIKNSFQIPAEIENYGEYILWVGSARPVKRPKVLLNLARALPLEKFLMIMPPYKASSLGQLILEQARIIPNLKIIEGVPFDKIQTYFNKSKFLVGTSEYEGFPNVYLQACLAGKPIVSLKVNPDQFITKFDVGFVAADDEMILLKQCQKLLRENKLYQKKSENAYNYVHKFHNIENNIDKWVELIRRIT